MLAAANRCLKHHMVNAMIGLVEQNLPAIHELCRTYGVLRLDLFGSAATGAFDDATSDLDFVASFANTRSPGYADRYLGFADALEALFCRPVDVVTEASIRNPWFRQAVEASRQRVYEERDASPACLTCQRLKPILIGPLIFY